MLRAVAPETGTTVTAGNAPGWKIGLALVSLALSLLLWLNGLVDSLSRPSVGGDLNRRQLELAALAAPSLPAELRPLLAGQDPLAALAEALQQEIDQAGESGTPPATDLLLEQALLQQRRSGTNPTPTLLEQLQASGDSSGLLQQWRCEALQGAAACDPAASGRRAAIQLAAVTVLPVLLLLLGIGLLLRELWLLWRGRLPAAPALTGPPLGGVDVVLLIAGGFVVIGELLTPLLVTPLLTAAMTRLAITSPLREGLNVVALYLSLMAGPLLILALMLRGLGQPPRGGWLMFRWQPLAATLAPALKGLLLVLPLVSLVGWLQGQIWGDPGGSNPLLELVLNSHDLPALACFGFTAVVLAPLFEETIFRGVLLPVAGRRLGPVWGVLLSAGVFAVAHLSLGELLPLLVLGLGLGWLRWNGGRLGSCVLMHAFWNALTFTNLVVLGW